MVASRCRVRLVGQPQSVADAVVAAPVTDGAVSVAAGSAVSELAGTVPGAPATRFRIGPGLGGSG
jgi:hypothetical protein